MDSKEKKNDVREEKLEDIIRSIKSIIDDHNNSAIKSLNDTEHLHIDESILELTTEFKEDKKEDKEDKVYTEGFLSKETSDKFSAAIKDFAQKIDDPILKKRDTEADLIITNLIKPMLKEWLDNNLPRLVEKVIAEELKKLIPKK